MAYEISLKLPSELVRLGPALNKLARHRTRGRRPARRLRRIGLVHDAASQIITDIVKNIMPDVVRRPARLSLLTRYVVQPFTWSFVIS